MGKTATRAGNRVYDTVIVDRDTGAERRVRVHGCGDPEDVTHALRASLGAAGLQAHIVAAPAPADARIPVDLEMTRDGERIGNHAVRASATLPALDTPQQGPVTIDLSFDARRAVRRAVAEGALIAWGVALLVHAAAVFVLIRAGVL